MPGYQRHSLRVRSACLHAQLTGVVTMSDSSWWRQYSSSTAGGLSAALAFLLLSTLWPAAWVFFLGPISIPAGAWLVAICLLCFLAWRAYLRKTVEIEKVRVELLSPETPPDLSAGPTEPELSDIQLTCLKSLIDNEKVSKAFLANALNVGHQMAQFHIEELENSGLVKVSRDAYSGIEVQLSPKGRRYLADRNLL